jgi:thermitase
MRKSILWTVLFIIGSVLYSPLFSFAQDAPYVSGELLVAPKDGVSDTDLEGAYNAHGGKKIKTLSHLKVHHIKVPAHALDAIEKALRNNPKVEFVEKNFVAGGGLVPNDPGYSSQWHLPRISAPSGWDITTGSTSVPVAIIDSGVDPSHPDLYGKLMAGYNFLGNNTDTHDVLGHGTAVAGTAAAMTNSGLGVAGLAWANPIIPLVVLDSNNYATYANIASAITWAADHGAKAINISIGGPSSSSTLQNAVDYAWNKGVVIAASAMNNSSTTPYYPAALNHVMAVGATDQNDNLASFSNYGNWITVTAPGDWIYTTNNGGGYGYWYGTSFASPQVAALAALLFSANPALTNSQVVDLIKNNSDDLGAAGFDANYGWGRINAYRALAAAKTAPTTTVSITSPSSGSTVTGSVNVAVAASSTAGISQVELYVDGALKGSKSSAPYSFPWDTTGMSGSHSLTSKAYDGAGGQVTSAPDTVSVSAPTTTTNDKTPPTVQITSVGYDGKFLTVTVSASDAGGIARIELYVDGALKGTGYSSSATFRMNTKPWSTGVHPIQAKAYDNAGNSASASSSITK